jgi:hypothetical protein
MQRDRSHLTDPHYASRPVHAALINDMSDLLLPNRRFDFHSQLFPGASRMKHMGNQSDSRHWSVRTCELNQLNQLNHSITLLETLTIFSQRGCGCLVRSEKTKLVPGRLIISPLQIKRASLNHSRGFAPHYLISSSKNSFFPARRGEGAERHVSRDERSRDRKEYVTWPYLPRVDISQVFI